MKKKKIINRFELKNILSKIKGVTFAHVVGIH
ncbi:MAG: hypothetical protein KatS3mg035_1075 [Bacteroidia bacterium]|nr:MAG: hypothetical protein KatS3mg035_1075 [Bacteroidia bacterium]